MPFSALLAQYGPGGDTPWNPPAAAAPPPPARSSTVPSDPWIGGNPVGSSGPVANFGINTIPAPARGGTGALGGVTYQPNNPWANNLLSAYGMPVSPNDPAANLFRTMPPNSVQPGTTPTGTAPAWGGTAPSANPYPAPPAFGGGLGQLLGNMGGGAGAGGGGPMGPQFLGPPQQQQGGGGGAATSGSRFLGPPTQSGGSGGAPPMPFGGGGGGGGGGNLFGWTPSPSPLLMASNPAYQYGNQTPQSIQYILQALAQQQQNPAAAGGGGASPTSPLPPALPGAAAPPAPAPTGTMTTNPPHPIYGGGGGWRRPAFADGGLARMQDGGTPPPALPTASMGTGDPQIDNTRAFLARISGAAGALPTSQQGVAQAPLQRDPMAQSTMLNPNNDPVLASLLNANNPHAGTATGGDNSIASLLMRLGMRHPGVIRHGQAAMGGGYAQGGEIAEDMERPSQTELTNLLKSIGVSPEEFDRLMKELPLPSQPIEHSGVLNNPFGGGYSATKWGGAHGGSPLAQAGYVAGPSGGQEDKVNARLSDGEYVMDADTVSALGDGNNDAGATKLDAMRQNIRTHKRSAPATKIPPKAKRPEAYLGGKRKKTAASAAADIAIGKR